MGIIKHLRQSKLGHSADRRYFLGASEVAAVLGVSPWATPLDVWVDKQGDSVEGEVLAQHERGQYLESGIVRWGAAKLGALEVEDGIPISDPFVVDERWPNVGMHPDAGLRLLDGDRICEAKTSRDAAEWGDEDEAQLPQHILVQTSVQSAIAEVPVVCVAYLPIADKLKVYELERRPDIEDDIMTMAQEWWDRHVVCGIAPEIDGSKKYRDHLTRKSSYICEPMFVAGDDEARLLRDFLAAKAAAKEVEAEVNRLGNLLRQTIGDAEGFTCDDGKATWKWQQGASRIDITRLRKELPDVAEAYTVRGDDTRVLRVKGAKK
jgi:predicted phage-related endonuclease